MKGFILYVYRSILFIPLGICIEHDWENTQKKWMTAIHPGSWEFEVLDGKVYFAHSLLLLLLLLLSRFSRVRLCATP